MAAPILVGGTAGLTNTAVQVRGATCRVTGIYIFNPSVAVAFVQFFDTLAAPTVGTTVPVMALGTNTLGSVAALELPEDGVLFQNGLWVAATTTAGGAVAPGTNLSVNLALST